MNMFKKFVLFQFQNIFLNVETFRIEKLCNKGSKGRCFICYPMNFKWIHSYPSQTDKKDMKNNVPRTCLKVYF